MTTANIVEFLNSLLEWDRLSIGELIRNRVPCNDALVSHPTVPCFSREETGNVNRVGVLGLLNGIAAMDNGRAIGAEFDPDGILVRFHLVSRLPLQDPASYNVDAETAQCGESGNAPIESHTPDDRA